MNLDPKTAVDAAKDALRRMPSESADIVEDAGHILKGDIAGGVGAIVEDATAIATHAVDKAKEVFTSDKEDAGKEDAAE